MIATYDLNVTLACLNKDGSLSLEKLQAILARFNKQKSELIKKKKQYKQAPKVKIQEISAYGVVHITFSNNMYAEYLNKKSVPDDINRELRALDDPLEIIKQ